MEAQTDIMGRTALHLAADTTTLDRMEELLHSGKYNVNFQDARGHTPLHCLLMNSTCSDISDIKRGIRILLENGADVNIQDEFKDTPIHVVGYGHFKDAPEIVRFLLKVANSPPFVIELKNSLGYTVFYNLMYGYHDRLKTRKDFEEIEEETESLINDFLDGIVNKSYSIKQLLDMTDVHGYSAFHIYANNCDHDVNTFEKMISVGANVNTKSHLGITPLMDALSNRDDELVSSLLHAGADPNLCDCFGQSALFRVETKICFDLLCEFNADFSIKDRFGRIPINDMFMYVPEDLPRYGVTPMNDISSQPLLAESFFEHGLNSNEQDFHGSSLLHYAAYHGNPDMILTLLKNGADVNIIDKKGATPLDLAKECGNIDISGLLEKRELPDKTPIEKDKIKRYSELIINQTETNKMDKVLKEILNLNDYPQKLISQLLNSSRVGITFNQPETNELRTDILHTMKKLASFVSSVDPLFQCTVHPVGSSSDGSKIGDPDEFDFMFSLDIISEECVPYQTEEMLNSGFAGLKIKSFQVSHPLAKYATDDLSLKSYVVRDTFQELVTIALNKPEFWDSENLYFDGIIRFPTDKPILNLHFRRFGSIIKDIVVGIDIVPAIATNKWIPKEMADMNVMNEDATNDFTNYYLLFQPPEGGKFWEIGLRISASLQELHYLNNLPTSYIESYSAAKILISEYFCPQIQLDEQFEIDSIFEESVIEKGEEFEMDPSMDETAFSVPPLETEREDLEVGDSDGTLKDEANIVKDAVLVRNGSKYENLISWVVEIDETLVLRKLFTPTNLDKTVTDVSGNFGKRNALIQKCELIHLRKGKSKWIYLGPIESLRETIKGIPRGVCNDNDLGIPDKFNKEERTTSRKTHQEEDMIFDENDSTGSNSQNEHTGNNTLEWEGGHIIYAWEEISSYMLKNCIIHIASEIKGKQMDDQTEIIIQVFEKLRTCAESREMKSFFLPFLDVFTFANKQIRLVSHENLEREKEIHCERILIFCDLILGILRRKM